ncbi:MAG: hypothetical protein RR337_10380, partial [Clostridia bacterium]
MKGNIRMYGNTRNRAHNDVAQLIHDVYYNNYWSVYLRDLCDAAKLSDVQRAVITLRAMRRETLAACGLYVGYCSRISIHAPRAGSDLARERVSNTLTD